MTKVWLLSRTNFDRTKRWNYPRNERQPDYSGWKAGRRGDPCDDECPNSWVRDFYGVHAMRRDNVEMAAEIFLPPSFYYVYII